ncbi:MAG: hypothetical protein Q8K75_08370 [Chlamydiales bacterium]|nr:hypothetical protein [Chlamydiales bacterium]
MMEKTSWKRILAPLKFDENHARKMVGSVHFWDSWYIGRCWYHAAARSTCTLVALPWTLTQTTLTATWVLILSAPNYSVRDQQHFWTRLSSLTLHQLTTTFVNSLWASLPTGQLTTSYNGAHIINDDLYTTDNTIAEPHNSSPWGLLSIGWLSSTISFRNDGGECHGQCLLFTKLFYDLEKAIPDPEMRAYKIAQLFKNGSPREATILQGLAAAIKPRSWLISAKSIQPRSLFLIINLIVAKCAQSGIFGVSAADGLPRGTMFGLHGIARSSGEYSRWRDNAMLPFLGLSQSNMRTAANRVWAINKYGARTEKPVKPMPEDWENIKPGIYQMGLRGILLSPDNNYYGHTMLYIKISDDCGLIYNPTHGLARYVGKDHIQKIRPMYSAKMPELALFKMERKGLLGGPGLIDTLCWILRG